MPLHKKNDPAYAATADPAYAGTTTTTATTAPHHHHGATAQPGVAPGAGGLTAHSLPGPAPTTAGPHKSDLLNKLDPSVDSDMSNPKTQAAFEALHAQNELPGPAPNTAGPHRSDMMNKLDPRVDSDMSKTRGHAGTHHAPPPPGASAPLLEEEFGARAAKTVDPPITSGVGGTSHAAGYGAAAGTTAGAAGTHHHHHAAGTTVGGAGVGAGAGQVREGEYGPHSSRVGNAADPRVDSDLDGRHHRTAAGGVQPINAPETATAGYGTHGEAVGGYGYGGRGTGAVPSATYGTHNSRLANEADPRIDTAGYGPSGAGAPGLGAGAAHAHHPGPAPTTAGPHRSDMMNKLDPSVDSRLVDDRGIGHHSGPGRY